MVLVVVRRQVDDGAVGAAGVHAEHLGEKVGADGGRGGYEEGGLAVEHYGLYLVLLLLMVVVVRHGGSVVKVLLLVLDLLVEFHERVGRDDDWRLLGGGGQHCGVVDHFASAREKTTCY